MLKTVRISRSVQSIRLATALVVGLTATQVVGSEAADDTAEPGDEYFADVARSPASIEAERASAKVVSDAIVSVIKKDYPSVVVTSTFREGSKAHRRGAVDIEGTDVARAKAISKKLGTGYLLIIESVDAEKKLQTNTYYCNGELWRVAGRNPDKGVKITAFSSTGNASHIHIQKQLAEHVCR